MLVLLISIIGWCVVFAISLVNSTRAEAKDVLKEYNEQIHKLADRVCNFWDSITLSELDKQLRECQHFEQVNVTKVKLLRQELEGNFNINWNNDTTYKTFLESIEVMDLQSIKFMISNNTLTNFKAERTSKIIAYTEILYKEGKDGFYLAFPIAHISLKKLFNVGLLALVLLPPPLMFFHFFILQIYNL